VDNGGQMWTNVDIFRFNLE